MRQKHARENLKRRIAAYEREHAPLMHKGAVSPGAYHRPGSLKRR